MMLPNGTVKIIDRKKAIFKLSQGEYIAPEKIEVIYATAKFVAQVFVYGDSLQSCLVGVVIPDQDALMHYAKEHLPGKSFADVIQNQNVIKMIKDELVAAGKKAGLHSFEQVKAIHLDAELFSVENGLLTPSFKARRDQLKKRYESVIAKLYASLDV